MDLLPGDNSFRWFDVLREKRGGETKNPAGLLGEQGSQNRGDLYHMSVNFLRARIFGLSVRVYFPTGSMP